MNRFSTAFFAAAFLLMWSANILSAQTIQIPTRVSTDDIFGYRLQNFANDAAPGIYTGVPDLTLDDGRSTLRYVQWTPGDNLLEITYDGNGEGMLSVALINGNGINYYTTYSNIVGAVEYFKARPIADANGLTVAIGVQDPGVVLSLNDFTVDGVNLGALSNGTGTKNWSIGEVSMNNGFTITTTLNIAGAVSQTPTNCFIDLFASVLPTVTPATPTAFLAPCVPTSTSLFGVRLRSFLNSGSREIYAGVPDLGVGTNRTEVDATWVLGDNELTLTYDPVASTITATIVNANGTFTCSYAAVPSATVPDVLTISIAARDPGATISMNDLVVDGASLGALTNNADIVTWAVSGIDFSDGFTLSSTVNLAGTISASQEKCRIEIFAGSVSSTAKFSVGSCQNILKPCSLSSVLATASPTFDATIVNAQKLVVGTRVDGKPGAWVVYNDCSVGNVALASGGYVLPEVDGIPTSRGWQYEVTAISADGKWAAGKATMNNTDASDGNTNGFRHSLRTGNNKWINIQNGTVIGVKWQFTPDNGSVGLALPAQIGSSEVRTTSTGEDIIVGSTVSFGPETIIRDAFGDYWGFKGSRGCSIESTANGEVNLYTLAGNIWAQRGYNLKAIRPKNGLVLHQILPIQFFGPQRNTTPCDWYVVGIASGISKDGVAGLWQIRHQSVTNRVRFEFVGKGEDEKLIEFNDQLKYDNGWTYLIDPMQPMLYDQGAQTITVFAYALNEFGYGRRPFTGASEILPGTRLNLSYVLNVRLTFGDNCNAVHSRRSIECENIQRVPNRPLIVRCNDGAPVYGAGETITENDVDFLFESDEPARISPNPAVGITSIEVEGLDLEPTMATMVDAVGRALPIEFTRDATAITFDASQLSAGTYFVRLVTTDRVVTAPIVVR